MNNSIMTSQIILRGLNSYLVVMINIDYWIIEDIWLVFAAKCRLAHNWNLSFCGWRLGAPEAWVLAPAAGSGSGGATHPGSSHQWLMEPAAATKIYVITSEHKELLGVHLALLIKTKTNEFYCLEFANAFMLAFF